MLNVLISVIVGATTLLLGLFATLAALEFVVWLGKLKDRRNLGNES